MPNTRSESSRERFGLLGGDRRSPRGSHKAPGAGFNEVTVEKRGLNSAVSKITVRPAPPKPIVTSQTASKPARGDSAGDARGV